MPETTWVDGDVATVAKLNQIEDQIIVTCTAGTRPTGVEGRRIFETDTNRELLYDGAAWVIMWSPWTAFTPVWTSTTLTDSTNAGSLQYSDGNLRLRYTLTFGASTAFTGSAQVDIPNSHTSANDGVDTVGVMYLRDSGASNEYTGIVRVAPNTTKITLFSQNNVNATNPFTWATGDSLSIFVEVPL